MGLNLRLARGRFVRIGDILRIESTPNEKNPAMGNNLSISVVGRDIHVSVIMHRGGVGLSIIAPPDIHITRDEETDEEREQFAKREQARVAKEEHRQVLLQRMGAVPPGKTTTRPNVSTEIKSRYEA